MGESKARILVVEDDASMQDFLMTFLEQEGYEVRWAGDGRAAQVMLEAEPFDVVITDIVMPEVDGVAVLDYVRARHPEASVIVMTGYSSVRQAVDLIRRGADDYFKKPFDLYEMLHVIQRSLAHRAAQRAVRAAEESSEEAAAGLEAGPRSGEWATARAGARAEGRLRAGVRGTFPTIVGDSPAMRPVFELIRKVADTSSTVLIQGASGTGKELVALAIHQTSSRRDGPFIPVHCGAIPETLLESELFGHERGSFTGAIARKEGVFKLADGGTLFLDEVSEMSVHLQVKLLRVLETGTFRRVGGTEVVHADVRVVAATNRELKELLDKNLFRQDLFYRLNVFPIVLPPLCEREGDISLLVSHFLAKLARTGRPQATVSEDAMALLEAYHWPGNVRELENVIERAVILSGGGEVRPEHLPVELRPVREPARAGEDVTGLNFRQAKAVFEKRYVEGLLARHDGNVAGAAQAAEVSRAHFYELIKKHHVDLSRYGGRSSPASESDEGRGGQG